MVGRGLHEIVGWSFTEPGAARPAARCPPATSCAASSRSRTRCRRDSRSCARRCSARCSTPPATTSPATAPRRRDLRVRAPSTGPPEGIAAARLADEHHALGVLLSGRADAAVVARASAPRPTSSPPRRCWRRCWTLCSVSWTVAAAASVAVPAPGAQRGGARRRARRSASSASCTRWSRRAGTCSARAAFAVDLGRLAAAAPAVRSLFAPFGAFPALRQDIAVTLPDDGARPQLLERVRERGRRRRSSEARVFDVYSGEQVGEGRRSLALALSLPLARAHAHRRGRRAAARADRRGARRPRG